MDVDCWGGVGSVIYGFTVPGNAYRITWSLVGYNGGCCTYDGRVTKGGRRTSATHVNVGLRATSWRDYHVRRATVSYSWRVKI